MAVASRSRPARSGELVLEDQDPPLLLGDLVDLVAQLLVEALERLLDVRRVQGQGGDRAEGAEEGDLLVLVGHAAPLGAEHEQAGELRRRLRGRWPPRPPGRSWRRSPGRTPSPSAMACGSRTAGDLPEPLDQRVVGGQRPARRASGRGRRPAGAAWSEASSQVDRPPLQPQDLAPPPRAAGGPASPGRPGCRPPAASSASPGRTCTSRGRTAGRSPSGTAPRASSEEDQDHDHRDRRHHRPPRRRVRREELVADQHAADQEHPRVDQPRRHAEGDVDHAPVDDLLDLHQLVARDAEGVGHRVQQRDAEHRPGGAVAAQRRRVEPGLAEQVGDQERGEQRRPAGSTCTWFRSARVARCR